MSAFSNCHIHYIFTLPSTITAGHTKICADQIRKTVHVDTPPPHAVKTFDPEKVTLLYREQSAGRKQDSSRLRHSGIRRFDSTGIWRIRPGKELHHPGFISIRIVNRAGQNILATNPY